MRIVPPGRPRRHLSVLLDKLTRRRALGAFFGKVTVSMVVSIFEKARLSTEISKAEPFGPISLFAWEFCEQFDNCFVSEFQRLIFLRQVELLLDRSGPHNFVACAVHECENQRAFGNQDTS